MIYQIRGFAGIFLLICIPGLGGVMERPGSKAWNKLNNFVLDRCDRDASRKLDSNVITFPGLLLHAFGSPHPSKRHARALSVHRSTLRGTARATPVNILSCQLSSPEYQTRRPVSNSIL
ncbi:hypothetical protein B0T17DRAFT_10571 [Bombardia bombarda]|uniref:Secreted protein n=1 Tax=Bombardia bombarda TaxID=252184 RepID=A0AA39XJU0_9PEZI|nr:hypothetical protein B0T17DRAFT_10571 [Bombardia bombarda]